MLPLRDPSGLPISSRLCTSWGSRPHGDASRSIPAGSQCGGGGGDGGRSCDPGLSALRPRPSPPARSAPPRGPGCPASAPEAGRLDPGPLRPAGPLPYPRPPPTRTRLALGSPQALVRCGLGGEGLRDSPCRPGIPLPARDPAVWPPSPGQGCGWPTPSPPHRKCPSAASFPRWLAPRPL